MCNDNFPTKDKCQCGEEPGEWDSCPFALEIREADVQCNCCDACRHECAMDI